MPTALIYWQFSFFFFSLVMKVELLIDLKLTPNWKLFKIFSMRIFSMRRKLFIHFLKDGVDTFSSAPFSGSKK